MTPTRSDTERWTTPIVLRGGPPDYFRDGRRVEPNLRGSSMMSPPDDLRVALHRDAIGVTQVAEGKTFNSRLWRIERYRRTNKTEGWRGAAVYEWVESERANPS